MDLNKLYTYGEGTIKEMKTGRKSLDNEKRTDTGEELPLKWKGISKKEIGEKIEKGPPNRTPNEK